jgi:hypothetical protein
MDRSSWLAALARIDSALRPIAKAPVDLSDPNWRNKLKSKHPLDAVGVRDEAELLLLDILRGYAVASIAERAGIRALADEFTSFFWAAQVPGGESPATDFRLRLLHFALLDQGRDPRDAVLQLDRLCRETSLPPEEAAALRREVAQTASDVDRYGFGSTREMLLRGYGNYGRQSAPERS